MAFLDPVLDTFDGRLDGFGDIDFGQVEFHDAGVDGRQIEDVVDDRQ